MSDDSCNRRTYVTLPTLSPRALFAAKHLLLVELARMSRRCLLTVSLCLAVIGTTQGQELKVREILRSVLGNERGEVATSVLELEDGGFLIAGYEYDDWDSEWDALILRVSPDGRQVWRRSSDRSGNDYAWVVRETKENRFVVVGTRTTAEGDTAGYMECIDDDGNEIWLRTYGGAKSEVLWAAERATDGGFFLAGQTDSEGAGGLDFYVVRTDAEGRELWSRAFGGPATDRAFGIDLSPDGGALVAGFQGENRETMNILLLRIDAKGRELWRRTLGGDRFDVAHDVQRVADGGFVIAGYTNSFGPGDQDGFLMRLTAHGRMLWMKTYGNADDDRVLHAAPMADGGFALIGYSRLGTGENWDMVVRRVDRHGDLVWSHRAGGALPDMGKDVIVTRDGSVVVVGGTRSENPPYDDILLLRLSENGAR